MFSDEILEKIFSHKELQGISLSDQSLIITIIEKVLEESGVNTDADAT